MGLGIGPFLYAEIYDARGSYEIIFYTSGALMGVATLLMWLAKRPNAKPGIDSGSEQAKAASATAE